MENASKALIIAGAILLSILLIAVGMYVYNSSIDPIQSAGSTISSYDKEAFNLKWEQYDGEQTGTIVQKLIAKMLSNADEYKEEHRKLPGISARIKHQDSSTGTLGGEDSGVTFDFNEYVATLGDIRGKIQKKHMYYVTFGYSETTGLINMIHILYDKEDRPDLF